MDESDRELEKSLKKFVTRDATISESMHIDNFNDFDGFIAREEKEIVAMRQRRDSPVSFKAEDRCSCQALPKLRQIKEWVQELNREIYTFQLSRLDSFLTHVRQLRNYLSEHDDMIIDFDGLKDQCRCSIITDQRYQILRRHRASLLGRGKSLIASYFEGDVVACLQTELMNAVGRYDSAITYSPPSIFDSALEEYILHCPELLKLVAPAVAVIGEGTVMAMLSTLSEFNLAILESLKIYAPSSRAVVYTSLVRFLFGIGYTVNPRPLMGTDEENLDFLKICRCFAGQTVKDLVLANSITKNYTPGLPLGSLFKSTKVDMLKPMELVTNPIDLMHYVHTILGSLARLFATSDQFLSFDDTLTLLLALLSINPPGNAIPIAQFVVKWEPVQISSVVSLAKNYFVVAVEHIQLFGRQRAVQTVPP